jgi:hypothetical protein
LLRTLLDAPYNRTQLVSAEREGEADGLRWHISTEPVLLDTGSRQQGPWRAVRLIASVSTGGGQMISAETVRLAKAE